MSNKILLFALILCFQSFFAQTVTTITDGSFHDGLAIDSQGNIYGSDFPPVPPWPNPVKSVYKYDTNGNVTVFATGFLSPNGIGINSQDEVYICDHYGNNIKKFSSDGTLLMTTPQGQFITPSGIKPIPNTLDMLVVEYNTGKIKRLNSDGQVTTLHTGSPLLGPAGITYIDDVPYIANFNNRKIFQFINNTLTEVAQLPSNGDPETDFLGFITSANGLLYATHFGANSIYTINPNTIEVSLFAGSNQGNTDGDISVAKFNGPNGIIADKTTGKIYVSDAGATGTVKNLRIITNAFLSVSKPVEDIFDLQLFPIPAQNSLNVKLKLKTIDDLKIQIIDVNGKEIYKKEVVPESSNFTLEIPTTKWQKGLYIFKFSQNNTEINKKIII